MFMPNMRSVLFLSCHGELDDIIKIKWKAMIKQMKVKGFKISSIVISFKMTSSIFKKTGLFKK